MKRLFLVFALGLSTVAAAQAPSGASDEASGGGQPATVSNPGQVVCRNVADLGTRLARTRVCRTRAEWEASRRDSRQTIERAQSSRTTNNGQ